MMLEHNSVKTDFAYIRIWKTLSLSVSNFHLQGADLKMKQIENSNFSTSADHKEMNKGLKETSNLALPLNHVQ